MNLMNEHTYWFTIPYSMRRRVVFSAGKHLQIFKCLHYKMWILQQALLIFFTLVTQVLIFVQLAPQ